MALSDLTKDRMQQVIDLLRAAPNVFSMADFKGTTGEDIATLPTKDTCGTVGCVAGYAQCLYLNQGYENPDDYGYAYTLDEFGNLNAEVRSDAFLGITPNQGKQLYYMGQGRYSDSLWPRYSDHIRFLPKLDWYETNPFYDMESDDWYITPLYENVTAKHAVIMLEGLIDGTFEFFPTNS